MYLESECFEYESRMHSRGGLFCYLRDPKLYKIPRPYCIRMKIYTDSTLYKISNLLQNMPAPTVTE